MGEPIKPQPVPRNNAVVDLVAREKDVKDQSVIEGAKKAFATRKALKDLVTEVGGTAELSPEKARSANGLVLESERRDAITQFEERVKAGDSNFADQNVLPAAVTKLNEFCKVADPLWPAEQYRAYVEEICSEFESIVSLYTTRDPTSNELHKPMTSADVDAFFARIAGQGSTTADFKTWFEANHPTEFTEWKKSSETSALKKKYDDARAEITEISKFPELEKRFDQLGNLVTTNGTSEDEINNLKAAGVLVMKEHTRAAQITERFNKLPEKLRNGLEQSDRDEIANLAREVEKSDGNNIFDLQKIHNKWDERLPLLKEAERLQNEPDKIGAPESIWLPVAIAVLRGEKKSPEIKAAVGAYKAAHPEQNKEAPKTKPAPGEIRAPSSTLAAALPAGEEAGALETWVAGLDELPDGGDGPIDRLFSSLKKAIKPFAAVVMTLVAKFSKGNMGKYMEKYAGISIRDTWISSEWLADHGDERAKVAVEGKKRLRGVLQLSSESMNAIRGMTAKTFLAAMTKPDDLTKDAAEKAKLTALADKLKPKVTKQTADMLVAELAGSTSGGQPFLALAPVVIPAPTPAAPAAQPAAPATPADIKPVVGGAIAAGVAIATENNDKKSGDYPAFESIQIPSDLSGEVSSNPGETITESTDKEKMVLTFDVCSPYTGEKLDKTLQSLALIKEKSNFPVTIFVTGVALKEPKIHDALVQLKDLPHVSIQAHGHEHHPATSEHKEPIEGQIPTGDLKAAYTEIVEGAKAVEQLTGKKPQFFRSATLRTDPKVEYMSRQINLRMVAQSADSNPTGAGGAAKKGAVYLGHVINFADVQRIYSELENQKIQTGFLEAKS